MGDVLGGVDYPSHGIDVDRMMRCSGERPLADPERSRPGLDGFTHRVGNEITLIGNCRLP